MNPRVSYPARIGCLRLLVLALGLLPLGNSLAQERTRLGYWKLAGPVEFWVSKLPPTGPAKHSYSGGAQTTYVVAAGKVEFTNTWTNNKAIVVGEVTWAPPPAAIHPGEVVDVAGTAALLRFDDGKTGMGAEVGLICQFGPLATERPGVDRALGGGVMMLGMEKGSTLKARSGTIGGVPQRRKVEYKNTSEIFGQKGQKYTGSIPDFYLVFSASGGGDTVKAAYRYVWSPVE